ncbi:precorrin-6y C5,15-methyltransferase (decarboxylating) subunit CbiE [Phytoactinopolyspora mesophila]|uniref:precorrin-6y C5,15-methyltransferase (decarboxylating) subunit CbiE n=1 Tax=Phytoactinopolyspora mesophila TaxID=2650750 RepID=UPI001C9E4A8A
MNQPPAAASPAMITVVGIGADGLSGLSEQAREAVAEADVLIGGQRHLDLVPLDGVTKLSWPSPFRPGLQRLFDEHRGRKITVLASGDPMVSGVGSILAKLFGMDAVRILPTVSSVSLARARLGWSSHGVDVVRLVDENADRVARFLTPRRRLLVLSADASTPGVVAEALTERGYGPSRMIVLENLGGPGERRFDGVAREWNHPPGAALNVVAVECESDHGTVPLPTVPGLPDEAFEHDRQLTKRDLRASCLARLMPVPGHHLWDVGAGSGSVAIEWMRAHPDNSAAAIEADPERAERIGRNARRLGVPDLFVVQGRAPKALRDLQPPDAVFLGGGVSTPGLIETCVKALRPGGRLVAHAVTLEAEAVLGTAYAAHGGELNRHSVEHAAPLGRYTGWQPARTLTQWHFIKEE